MLDRAAHCSSTRLLVEMCGRFSLYSDPAHAAAVLGAELTSSAASWQPRYNIAPTTAVLACFERGDRRVLAPVRWGFYAQWKPELAIFNARSETARTKSSFALSFKHRRAIVPADGFFEWHRVKGARPEPHFFTRSDGQMLLFASLWAPYDPGDEGALATSILTTSANEDMAEIHDRMPVVLDSSEIAAWLNDDDEERHQAMCRPATAGTLVHRVVDPAVGRAGTEGAQLLEPPPPPATQSSLF